MASLVKLYHITNKDHGSTTVWYPKKTGSNRSEIEPKIPRICFAKNLIGCFLSLGYILRNYSNWFLYTAHVNNFYSPTTSEVIDCKITNEVWRLSRTKLDRKYQFSKNEMENISQFLTFVSGNPSGLKYQKSYKNLIKKELNKLNIYEKI